MDKELREFRQFVGDSRGSLADDILHDKNAFVVAGNAWID